MQGLGWLQESTTARSPLTVLNSLHHRCLTHCRPVWEHCGWHVSTSASHSVSRQKLRHGSTLKYRRQPSRSYSNTACSASAATADPAVTGKEQIDASALTSDTPSPSVSSAYPFSSIEAKWQEYWSKHKTFKTPELKDLDTSKPKFYALDMFPYPRCVLFMRLPSQGRVHASMPKLTGCYILILAQCHVQLLP